MGSLICYIEIACTRNWSDKSAESDRSDETFGELKLDFEAADEDEQDSKVEKSDDTPSIPFD